MRYGGFIAAIILAAIAAMVVMRVSPAPAPSEQVAPQQQGASVKVYVAATAISPGTILTAEMLALQPWPESMVLDGFIREDSAMAVSGMISRGTFQAGEPILSTKVANPQDANFIVANLPKGMRAVAIKTDMIDSVAGFVFPGDRVDVMLTREINRTVVDRARGYAANALREEKDSITETLLTNAQVLAVDRRTEGGPIVTQTDAAAVYPETVSLMVSQEDAQRLRLGETKGRLSLTLRGIKDRDGVDPLLLTMTKDISQYKDEAGIPRPLSLGGASGGVRVVRGTNVRKDASAKDGAPSPSFGFVPPATLGQ